jgi:hypothetical protein
MTEKPELKDMQSMFADEYSQAWMEAHLAELRHSASGLHFLYWSLALSFVVGLAAHVGGYELLLSAPREPLGLLADLLHALGWSLWTGVVVVVFLQIVPEEKKRQVRQALEAYEAFKSDQEQAQPSSQG